MGLPLTTVVLVAYLTAANWSPATAQTSAQDNSISLKWFRGIVVGNAPSYLAITPNGKALYVSNYGSNTVSVIDTSLYTIIATIGVSVGPTNVAITPDGRTAFVLSRQTISVISTATNALMRTISAGPTFGVGLAITPDGSQLYVCNFGSGRNDGAVTIINIDTLTIEKTLTLGGEGEAIAISPDGKSAYALALSSQGIYLAKIDVASQAIVQPQLGAGIIGGISGDLAISPNSETIYVAGAVSDVWAVNAITGKLKKTLVVFTPTGFVNKYKYDLGGVRLSSNGKFLFVADNGHHAVTVFNAWNGEQVGSPVTVGRHPYGIVISPETDYLYVANARSYVGSEPGTVSIVKIERP